MARNSALDAIGRGEASLSAGRRAVELALRRNERDAPLFIYGALRSWTWKALTARRRDGELSGWHDLIRTASARLRSRQPSVADRLRVLSELVYESVRFAEANPASAVMKRDHVQKIFEILKRSPKGEMRREELLERVGLKQANLSRVLLIMEACGLIERAPQGRRMMIRLPDAEREQLRKAHRQVTTAKKGIWDRNIPIKEGDILIRQEGRYHEPGSYRPQSYWRFISEATAQRHGERVGQQHDLLIDPFIKPIKISRERRGFFESPSTDRKGALIRMEAASSLVTWAPKDGTRVFSKLKEGVHERSERDR